MGIIAKNSFWVTVINMVGVLIATISILFVQTKFLTEKEIGTIKVLNSLALLIYPFILYGISNAIMKFHHLFEKEQKQYNQFVTYCLLVPFIILVFFTGISLLLKSYIENIFFNDSPYLANLIYLLPGLIFYFIYISISESFLAIKGDIIIPALLKSVIERLYLIALVILYSFNYISFNSLLILYVLFFILNAILLLTYTIKHFKIKYIPQFGFIKTKGFKEFNTFSMYIIFASIGSVIVAQIDTLMTGHLLNDLGEVGVYTIAFFMAMVIEIPKRPLIQISVPLISKKLSENKLDYVHDLYKKSSINLMIIGSFIFLVIWTNIDYIFSIIPNGDIYSDGKYVVFFIGLSKLFDLATGVNFEIIQYSKFYKWNIFLTPLLALITIVTNYYFITAYGITGTAIATAITILTYNMIRSFLVYYKLKMNAINYRHLILTLLIAGVYFIVSSFSFTNVYAGIIINSSLICIFFIVPVYFLKLSDDFNGLLNKLIKKVTN